MESEFDVESNKKMSYIDVYNKYTNLIHSLDSDETENCLELLLNQDIFIIMDILNLIDIETNYKRKNQANFFKLLTAIDEKLKGDLTKYMDFETLENSKVIVSAKSLTQKIVKLKTKLFYKQQKFNLLREESEGYAKLISQLLNFSPTSLSIKFLQSILSQLIGYFNLDPCRVLDVILEIFSLKINQKNGQFIRYFVILINNYWDKYSVINQLLIFRFNSYKARNKIVPSRIFDMTAQLITHDMIICKNLYSLVYPPDSLIPAYTTPVVSQIKNYCKQLPLLIKDLDDWENNSHEPECLDSDWVLPKATLQSKIFSNLDDIISGRTNSQENSQPPSHAQHSSPNVLLNKQTGDKKGKGLSQLDNYKLHIATSLMKFGGWKYVDYIIKKYPHLYLYTDRKFLEYARRYLFYLITPYYLRIIKKLSPALIITERRCQSLKRYDRCRVLFKNSVNDPSKVGKRTIRSIGDLFKSSCGRLLNFLGPHVFDKSNLYLVNQLLSIAKYYLLMNLSRISNISFCEKDRTYRKIIQLFKNSILPSLSQSSYNCILSAAVGDTLKLFHYQHRYFLYSHWKKQERLMSLTDLHILKYSHFIVSKIKTNAKSKYIMKRLSKDNVKHMSRKIGKLSHSNPGVLFQQVLNQIQSYENLIDPVIDTMRYITVFSFDVLIYCLIEAMCDGNKVLIPLPPPPLPSNIDYAGDGFKPDPTSTSALASSFRNNNHYDLTFVNLCVFSGGLVRKYGVSDVTGLLTYAVNGLKFSITNYPDNRTIEGETSSSDTPPAPDSRRDPNSSTRQGSELLLVVKELVHKMSGIEMNDTSSTREQLEALSGGDVLRSEAGYYSQIRNIKRSSLRLKEALLNSDILIPLAILIAQQRDCEIYCSANYQDPSEDLYNFDPFSDPSDHVKLIGRLHDEAQDTLVQYVTFVATHFSVGEYVHLLPSLASLINKYHLSFDAAFFIRRHSLALTLKGDKYFEFLKHLLKEEAENIAQLLPPKAWEDLTPLFFVTFWTFSRYDIYFPAEAYAREIAKIKHTINNFDDSSKVPPRKRKKEKEKLNVLVHRLKEEEKTQKEHVKTLHESLEQLKDDLFYKQTMRNDMISQFLQTCIFPRVKFSVLDAIYSAEFIKMLHYLKVPSFATVICLDRIFCDATFVIMSFSENEAARYGIFLKCLMEMALLWHSSFQIYEKNCSNYPGFLVQINPPVISSSSPGSTTSSPISVTRSPNKSGSDSDQLTPDITTPITTSAFTITTTTTSSKTPEEGVLNTSSPPVSPFKQALLLYEDYRHICSKWHYKLTRAFVQCLESGSYVSIRNALIILTKLLPCFPVLLHLGSVIETKVEMIKEDEKDMRPDLYALALSYSGLLKAKMPKMILEKGFHNKQLNPKILAKEALLLYKTESSPPQSLDLSKGDCKGVSTAHKSYNNNTTTSHHQPLKIPTVSSPVSSKKTPLLADPRQQQPIPSLNKSSTNVFVEPRPLTAKEIIRRELIRRTEANRERPTTTSTSASSTNNNDNSSSKTTLQSPKRRKSSTNPSSSPSSTLNNVDSVDSAKAATTTTTTTTADLKPETSLNNVKQLAAALKSSTFNAVSAELSNNLNVAATTTTTTTTSFDATLNTSARAIDAPAFPADDTNNSKKPTQEVKDHNIPGLLDANKSILRSNKESEVNGKISSLTKSVIYREDEKPESKKIRSSRSLKEKKAKKKIKERRISTKHSLRVQNATSLKDKARESKRIEAAKRSSRSSSPKSSVRVHRHRRTRREHSRVKEDVSSNNYEPDNLRSPRGKELRDEPTLDHQLQSVIRSLPNSTFEHSINETMVRSSNKTLNGEVSTVTPKRLKTRRDTTESTAQALLMKAREAKFKSMYVENYKDGPSYDDGIQGKQQESHRGNQLIVSPRLTNNSNTFETHRDSPSHGSDKKNMTGATRLYSELPTSSIGGSKRGGITSLLPDPHSNASDHLYLSRERKVVTGGHGPDKPYKTSYSPSLHPHLQQEHHHHHHRHQHGKKHRSRRVGSSGNASADDDYDDEAMNNDHYLKDVATTARLMQQERGGGDTVGRRPFASPSHPLLLNPNPGLSPSKGHFLPPAALGMGGSESYLNSSSPPPNYHHTSSRHRPTSSHHYYREKDILPHDDYEPTNRRRHKPSRH